MEDFIIALVEIFRCGFRRFVMRHARFPRFGPSRREPRWQWISVGSVVTAIAWLAASALLSWYLAHFANYDTTYGSLGAGIGLMMWMWISSNTCAPSR